MLDQSGQLLPWVAAGMFGLIGVTGLTIDVGHAYVAYKQLQSSTSAAALAAAGSIYNANGSASASSLARSYGSADGGKNVSALLSSVTTSVTMSCLNILMPKGTTCNASSSNNAIRVTQKARVSTYFMRVFGFKTIDMSATATAAVRGIAKPWNVAIIIDATGSMSTVDANCGGVTEFKCAMNGVKALLSTTNPCAAGISNCAQSDANFRVSLFSFPNVDSKTVAYDSNCLGKATYDLYTLPIPGAASYAPNTYKENTTQNPQSWKATYQIVDFSSDYYQPTSSNGLNAGSPLVKAVTGCMSPISSVGSQVGALKGASSGGITYYASAIYAAQSALVAEQAKYPESSNAIILLSDGQANLVSATGDFPTNYLPSPTGSALYNVSTSSGLYPSSRDECQQAIVAAASAAKAGTRIYSVAYGSQQAGCTSGSGATDTSLVAKGSYNVPVSLSTLTPCVTMEDIASSLEYFYSDYNQSGSGSTCQDASHSVVNLQDIFLSIASTFGTPQLVPNDAK